MTIAKDKQHFIEVWNANASELKRLMNTAESLETMKEIETAIETLKTLIQKVADEGYGWK